MALATGLAQWLKQFGYDNLCGIRSPMNFMFFDFRLKEPVVETIADEYSIGPPLFGFLGLDLSDPFWVSYSADGGCTQGLARRAAAPLDRLSLGFFGTPFECCLCFSFLPRTSITMSLLFVSGLAFCRGEGKASCHTTVTVSRGIFAAASKRLGANDEETIRSTIDSKCPLGHLSQQLCRNMNK